MSTLAAFSITPMGAGAADDSGSVAAAVASVVRVVRESGLANETNAMFTNVEGELGEVMALVERCTAQAATLAPRVSVVVKLDVRAGVEGAMAAKVAAVERHLAAADMLALYDARLRRPDLSRLPSGVTTEADGPVVCILGWHVGFVSAPADLGVTGDELDGLITRQRDRFAARGEAVEWKTFGYDAPDLPARLEAAGFVPEPAETVVMGPAAPLASAAPPLPDGVALRSVTSEADLVRIAAMETEAWGADRSHLARNLQDRLAAGGLVLVAEAGDAVVAAAWADLEGDSGVVSLWGGSTLVAWRRRGIYRALVAARAAWALERGASWLQVDASDDSRPILERLGLAVVTTTTPYVWSPPAPR